jgi:hypothetical protein
LNEARGAAVPDYARHALSSAILLLAAPASRANPMDITVIVSFNRA